MMRVMVMMKMMKCKTEGVVEDEGDGDDKDDEV